MGVFKKKSERYLEEQLKGTGLPVIKKPNSIISEQFRSIRTYIEYSMIDDDLKTIMVTSSTPFEGKSTISANIAAVFASQEKKVLYVDADMRKPTVHRTFGISNRIGLTTLLTKKVTNIQECCSYIEKANLYVLTSGPKPPNPAELLNSNRMTQLIEEFREIYDLIIFDLPPMINVTDPQIMATKIDGVIFVIRKDISDKRAIRKSKKLLDDVGANVIGAVFNGQDEEFTAGYYYSEEK